MKIDIKILLLILLNLYINNYINSINNLNIINKNKDNKTILLTGAAGFIGSNFLRYMFDKYPHYNFIVLDLLTYAGNLDNIPQYIKNADNFKFFHGSVTDENLVDKLMSQSNHVVHFAAESHVTRSIQDAKLFVDTDVKGTQIMLINLLKHKKNIERFIHISSSEVYGTAYYKPMDEEHPLNPKSPYAGAKAGADRLVYSYWATYDLPIVIVRPFNNYGPQQHLEKVIPKFITNAIKKRKLRIHGNGMQKRDWIYTLDVAKALDKILHIKDFDKIKNQVINLGSGNDISIKDIALMILKEFNLDESYLEFIADRPGQVEHHISSTKKAYDLLNWKAETKFEDGLKETIKWYCNNIDYWEKMENNSTVSIIASNGKIEQH